MADLTPDEFRQFQPTVIATARLQELIDDAVAEINRRYGAPGSNVTATVRGAYQGLLYLDRPASAIVSVREYWDDAVGLGGVDLDTTDWRLSPDGRTLERWGFGTHPGDYWSPRVEVTFTPADDSDARRRVTRQLVALELNYAPGIASLNLGGQYGKAQNVGESYAAQRRSILASMAEVPLFT